MDNPRAGTFCLLLAIGLGIWSVVNSLEKGRRRLTLRDPSNSAPARIGTDSPSTAGKQPSIIDSLDPAYLVEGRVVDPQEKPIHDALVRCGDIEVRSDQRGRFKLPLGSKNIEISHPDFFPASLETLAVQKAAAAAGVKNAQRTADTILQPGYSLGGTVYDTLGKPLSGGRVSFRTGREGYCGTVTTSTDGTWASPLLQRERTHILYNHPSCLTRFAWATPAGPGQKKPLEIVLDHGSPARIRVVNEKGSYLAEARVWSDRPVSTGEADSVCRYLGRTDDLGLLECALGLPTARRIRVRHVGYHEKIIEVAPAKDPGDTRDLEITLLAGLVLRAHAVDNATGLPVKPESVEVELQADGDFHPVRQSGLQYHSLDGGEIRFGLPGEAGKFRLRVSGEGNLYGVSKIIDFDGRTSPEPCLVRLDPSRSLLQGLVTFEQEAVAGAQVELLSAVGTWSGHALLHGIKVARPTRAVMSTYTDSGGHFGFRQFEPGTYRIRVTHPRYAACRGDPVELPLADPAKRYPLRLTEGAAIEGQVLSQQGKPIGAIPVVLSCAGCSPRSAWTNPQGRYSFSGLPTAADIRIAVGNAAENTPADDARWAGRGRKTSPSAQSLQLRPGERRELDLITSAPDKDGGLRGTVALDGRPLDTSLRLLSLPEKGRSPVFFSDENGGFSMTPLPPGKYRVTGEGFPFERMVNIEAGKTTRLTVSLESLVYDLEIASALSGEPIRVPCTITAKMVEATASQKSQAPWTERKLVAAEGKIILDGLLPVTYRIRIETENHIPATVRINPAESARGRATLKRGQKTWLSLKKPSGEIFEGDISVVIFDHSGLMIHDERLRVHGELELPALPSGSYKVEVRTRKKPFRYDLTITGS